MRSKVNARVEQSQRGDQDRLLHARHNHNLIRRTARGSVGQLSVGGGADEGQPGFTFVLAKAVLSHQWFQSAG